MTRPGIDVGPKKLAKDNFYLTRGASPFTFTRRKRPFFLRKYNRSFRFVKNFVYARPFPFSPNRLRLAGVGELSLRRARRATYTAFRLKFYLRDVFRKLLKIGTNGLRIRWESVSRTRNK